MNHRRRTRSRLCMTEAVIEFESNADTDPSSSPGRGKQRRWMHKHGVVSRESRRRRLMMGCCLLLGTEGRVVVASAEPKAHSTVTAATQYWGEATTRTIGSWICSREKAASCLSAMALRGGGSDDENDDENEDETSEAESKTSTPFSRLPFFSAFRLQADAQDEASKVLSEEEDEDEVDLNDDNVDTEARGKHTVENKNRKDSFRKLIPHGPLGGGGGAGAVLVMTPSKASKKGSEQQLYSGNSTIAATPPKNLVKRPKIEGKLPPPKTNQQPSMTEVVVSQEPTEVEERQLDQPESTNSSASATFVRRELNDTIEGQHDNVKGTLAKKDAFFSPFVSSGYWGTIDGIFSFGLASKYPSLRPSRRLRPIRKLAARTTGLHGLLSGKKTQKEKREELVAVGAVSDTSNNQLVINEDDRNALRRRLRAIELARERLAEVSSLDAATSNENQGLRLLGRSFSSSRKLVREVRRQRNQEAQEKRRAARQARREEEAAASIDRDPYLVYGTSVSSLEEAAASGPEEHASDELSTEDEDLMEKARITRERVKEIDQLILEGQERLVELQCEKDFLQQRPNPLFNYTASSRSDAEDEDSTEQKASRIFNFPSEDLVTDYVDELVSSGRLMMLNHTELWHKSSDVDDGDDSIGDDLLTPSAEAHKLYEAYDEYEGLSSSRRDNGDRSARSNGGGGSWLLRQSLGKGGTLGEKLGATLENLAYKSVCAALMSSLARTISMLHGINILTYSDVRLYMEDAPDLPPVGRHSYASKESVDKYAQEAITKAIRKGSSKRKSKKSRSAKDNDSSFLQRDAVVETLISHCQISAPLLKLFPPAWQRAMLGNIVTLIAAIMTDFCAGIRLQVLGHQLSFSFKPITERDLVDHMSGRGYYRFNHRRSKREEFEAAVQATAQDISEQLQFLDKWHERALGGGMLRAQLANLVARLVLTLADETLSGAQIDLWSAEANGPRMVAGLEYRPCVEEEKD